MDVDKLIEAAKHCVECHACADCGHQMEEECMHVLGYSERKTGKSIIDTVHYYESKLKAQRDDIREWVESNQYDDGYSCCCVSVKELSDKLDEMEGKER